MLLREGLDTDYLLDSVFINVPVAFAYHGLSMVLSILLLSS